MKLLGLKLGANLGTAVLFAAVAVAWHVYHHPGAKPVTPGGGPTHKPAPGESDLGRPDLPGANGFGI